MIIFLKLIKFKINTIRKIIRQILSEQFDEDTLIRMSDFGMDESSIDPQGYVTLYHGGKELPEFLRPNETLFMTPSEDIAEDYAQMRGGKVFTILVKPEDVSWNTGSGEVEFDRGGEFLFRDYPGEGVYILYPNKKSISEEIVIPIEVGDEILGGKFKNKKIKVKEIGKNEKGEVTINGKPLMRFRIPKTINESIEHKPTCLYIHGLGAKINDKVKSALSDYKILYPQINYNGTTEPYYQCLKLIDQNQVDFIIGHSIGGVMAYWLAKEKNIPALLLCPAFGDDYTVYVSKSIKRNTPDMMAIIGTKDNEVNNKIVLDTLKKQPNCSIKKAKIGHDVSEGNLKNFCKLFIAELPNEPEPALY